MNAHRAEANVTRGRIGGLALAVGLAAMATATPALAHCYKFKNEAHTPRTLMLVGGGALQATLSPGATWPERGEYCAYGATVIVTVEPGWIADVAGQFIAGDGPTAKPSGTYNLK